MSPRDATERPTYLAIDLGASSGRAMLGTLEDGRMSMREVHRFRTPVREDGARLWWDIEALWASITTSLSIALEAAPQLRSVSVDSWAVDYVPLDVHGTPVRAPHAYRDERTKGRMAAVAARLGAAALYARTGIQFLDINTLPQVSADLDLEPELVAATVCRLLIADYFLYRLSGQRIAERSMASTTQLFDARTAGWAIDLIAAMGDDPARWPVVVASGTMLGDVSYSVLPAGAATRPVVIASCSHDTAAAVAAIPADPSTAWSFISSGTWSLVGAEIARPILTERARLAGFTNEAGFHDTTRFLKNRTGFWILEECMREWSSIATPVSLDTLFVDAEAEPRSEGTLDLDAREFADRGGMIYKLESACVRSGIPVPSSPGALVRLVLESLAASYRETLAELDALLGRDTTVLHIVGGGARNRLLNQLTADACGVRVIAGPEEATALGNLLVQAHTLRDLPRGVSVRDAARASTTLKTYLPRGARRMARALSHP